ncbi:MarR family winged helix-turn-helix transcriptional regulator [Carboxylicivirga sp. N1Y90]|uniref:MarR family winged helix-turn-helix transcriptional regulator n=1 Tax=Carboxylicivirga fragile TaxID=3417571 RepID=UPI003D32496B|nr:winged helix-turn-helix transcriptional regulator [Marinilabiliaceae bacterium N1Y90]
MYVFQDSIGRLAGEVSRHIGRALVKAFAEKGYDISAKEWGALSYLYNNKGMNQNAIKNAVGLDKVGVKRLVDSLEQKKMVKRKVSLSDKRNYVLNLTKFGNDSYTQLSLIADEVLLIASKDIEKKEITAALDVLKRFITNLDE